MSGEPLVRAESLHALRGTAEVLRGIDLSLAEGEIVAVMGPNGAGKSTLLEVLAGLLAPSRGSVTRRARVALAMQAPDLARRSVSANVELALSWWGVPRSERRARAREALVAMRAEHLAGRPAGALSGGERRRVHLARAVAVRPPVLLLDEPFAGLDAESRATLLEDTGGVLRAFTTAAAIVVHDRAEAWALADRLIVLIDGRQAAAGSPRELLDTPPTVEVARFLGFDGTITRPDRSLLLTRPGHVQLGGDLPATVTRVIPLEDGVRLELAVEGGRLYARAPLPGPQRGASVGVRVDGGVAFAPAAREAQPERAQPVSP